jgi:hypothetical protein
MTDEQYLETRRALVRACVDLEGLDLEGLAERCRLARAAGSADLDLEAVLAMADGARLMVSVYREHPRVLLGLIADAYSPEELAQAGVV